MSINYKKPTPRDLRQVNRAQILRNIYFNGPISRLEVSQEIGISPATVTNIVNNLLENGILIESGIRRSEGGRPSTLLAINPDYGKFLGIEVGETYITIELFDILFNTCQSIQHPLSDSQITQQQIVAGMVDGIREILRLAGISENEIIGAGIGFPGLVDPINGVSIFTPNWGWHNVSITDQLREHLAIPMYLDNGAKAMSMGEALFGAGKQANDLAVLLVGTGVGSGIMIDRALFRGSSNNAGEFGHTSLNIDGPQCRCGSRGCMEVYIGANGIIERYTGLVDDPNRPPVEDQISFIKYIIAQAESGRPEAIETIDETIRYFGVSIANIINAVNPELLLLGGWSGLLFGSNYLERIEQVTAQYAMQQSLAKTTIRLCQLGYGSVPRGAAALVLESFFETAGDAASLMVGGKAVGKK